MKLLPFLFLTILISISCAKEVQEFNSHSTSISVTTSLEDLRINTVLSSDERPLDGISSDLNGFRVGRFFQEEITLRTTSIDTFLLQTTMTNGRIDSLSTTLTFTGTQILNGPKVIVNNDSIYTVNLPRVFLGLERDGNQETVILLELDLEKSVIEQANGNYIFEPIVSIRKL